MAVEKTRNGGSWTEARYTSFIKGLLRRGTMKWGPIHECKKMARIERGIYLCAGCKQGVPATTIVDRKRVNNIHVDHIDPIVDPALGFTTWDDCINRMFVEVDKLQVLCTECHNGKTYEEKQIAKERRANDKRV